MRRLFGVAAAMVVALLLLAPAVLAADPLPHTGRVLLSTGGDITLPAGEHADAVIVVERNGDDPRRGQHGRRHRRRARTCSAPGPSRSSPCAARSRSGPTTVVQGDVMTLDSLVHQIGNAEVAGAVKDLAS